MAVDPSFSILGAFIGSQDKSDAPLEENSTEVERNQALDACLAASELFEFGITLNNSVYRCRSLCSLKLLHAMRCEELGCVDGRTIYLTDELYGVRMYANRLIRLTTKTKPNKEKTYESKTIS